MTNAVDLTPSFVRTAVPLIVGPLLARYGFDADDPNVVMLLSAGLGWLYYVIVRLLEQKAPNLGYLLGMAKQPTYVNPPATVMDEHGTRHIADDAEGGSSRL